MRGSRVFSNPVYYNLHLRIFNLWHVCGDQVAFDLYHISQILINFNSDKHLRFNPSCDASSYGIGAALSHIIDNGNQEKLLTYTFLSLNIVECKYSQLYKETFAIVLLSLYFIILFMTDSLHCRVTTSH